MTKCIAYWKIVGEFKNNQRFVEKDGEKLTGFDGFMLWCGDKSYSQVRHDWATYETLELLAKKLNTEPCQVLSNYNLTAKKMNPIIFLRKYVGRDTTAPSELQEKIIEKLMPKLLSKKLSPAEIREAVKDFVPGPRRVFKPKEMPPEAVGRGKDQATGFDKQFLLNSALEFLAALRQPGPPEELVSLLQESEVLVKKLLEIIT